MLLLRCDIRIGAYRFSSVDELEIVSSYETLTDTCTLTLPQNLYLKGISIKSAIKRGDIITIDAGYYPNISRRFEGFVVSVLPNDKVVI